MYLNKIKISIETNRNTKLSFVVTYLNDKNTISSSFKHLSIREQFLDLLSDAIFGRRHMIGLFGYFPEKNKYTLKYSNDIRLINELFFYKIKKSDVNMYSRQYLTNVVSRHLRNELMEKAWHPSRFQDWCLSEDQK